MKWHRSRGQTWRERRHRELHELRLRGVDGSLGDGLADERAPSRRAQVEAHRRACGQGRLADVGHARDERRGAVARGQGQRDDAVWGRELLSRLLVLAVVVEGRVLEVLRRLLRDGAILADVGDAVGVLVPDAARAHPALLRIAEDAEAGGLLASGARDLPAVGVGDDQQVGVPVVVDVRDDGLLVERARGVAGLEEDLAGGALVDVQRELVGVDDLGFAVAVEVEERAPGAGRAAVLGLVSPEERVGIARDELLSVEDHVTDRARERDVRDRVVVETADGHGAAAILLLGADVGETSIDVEALADDAGVGAIGARLLVLPHQQGAALVERGDDLGLAVAVEVRDGRARLGAAAGHRALEVGVGDDRAHATVRNGRTDDVVVVVAIDVRDGEGALGERGRVVVAHRAVAAVENGALDDDRHFAVVLQIGNRRGRAALVRRRPEHRAGGAIERAHAEALAVRAAREAGDHLVAWLAVEVPARDRAAREDVGAGLPFLDELAVLHRERPEGASRRRIGAVRHAGERGEDDFREIAVGDGSVAVVVVELHDDGRHHDVGGEPRDVPAPGVGDRRCEGDGGRLELARLHAGRVLWRRGLARGALRRTGQALALRGRGRRGALPARRGRFLAKGKIAELGGGALARVEAGLAGDDAGTHGADRPLLAADAPAGAVRGAAHVSQADAPRTVLAAGTRRAPAAAGGAGLCRGPRGGARGRAAARSAAFRGRAAASDTATARGRHPCAAARGLDPSDTAGARDRGASGAGRHRAPAACRASAGPRPAPSAARERAGLSAPACPAAAASLGTRVFRGDDLVFTAGHDPQSQRGGEGGEQGGTEDATGPGRGHGRR